MPILLILGWPFLEIVLLMKMGQRFGPFNMLTEIILSAAIGIMVLRFNGFTFMNRLNAAMAKGESVNDAMLIGFLLFFGGALLILPGVLTDIVGFVFVFPMTRWLICLLAGLQIKKMIKSGGIKIITPESTPSNGNPKSKNLDESKIIDI